MSDTHQRRVVVTGIGLVSGLGIGTEQTWEGLRAGRSGIAPITLFDAKEFACRFAGEVKDFDPARFIEKKEIKKAGRFIQFAIAAAEFAIEAAQFKVGPGEEAERTGVYIGSGIGGFEVIEREHKILLERGPSRISPFFIPATIINLASGTVAIRTGAKGPNSATATACTTSAPHVEQHLLEPGWDFGLVVTAEDEPTGHGIVLGEALQWLTQAPCMAIDQRIDVGRRALCIERQQHGISDHSLEDSAFPE